MFHRESLKNNFPRLIAIMLASCALFFDIRSIKNNENLKAHQDFDISSGIMPVVVLLNALGRAWDYREDAARKNQIKAVIPIAVFQLIQMGLSIASVSTQYEQPIAAPVLMGALTLCCMSYLNWQPTSQETEERRKTLLYKNGGRIAGALFGLGGVGLSTASMSVSRTREFFFAASMSAALGSLGESSARSLDILFHDKDKTTMINKIAAVISLISMMVSATLSSLATFDFIKLPLAFLGALTRAHFVFFQVAQYRSMKSDRAEQPLLPESVSINGDVPETETARRLVMSV